MSKLGNFAVGKDEKMTAGRYTLHKEEKLRHRSLVEGLFRNGKSIYEYPLRLMWRPVAPDSFNATFRNFPPEDVGRLQMMITVPKKKRKRAVDRVLIRRRIREAYRLNRLPLKENVAEMEDLRTLSMAFVYQHDENMPYSCIERKMKILLDKLWAKLHNSQTVSVTSNQEPK